ncbi:MAG: PTS system mannose/fructose/sorbose family transporter subunit IID [Solobacterium sp.]|nr:PTS system mannose/fructose/sorbose family transporter subunit IID [Solobacterium sp.]
MVVGTGKYTNTNEAFPLDRKTLNQIFVRSFFADASHNGETGSSAGWCWALLPGLKQIHKNEEDLALSMGHELEYVSAASPMATLAMGVTLALEQQKCDLETIRSARTVASAAADSFGTALFDYVIVPVSAVGCCSLAANGNIAGVLLYFAVLAVLSVLLRYVMLYYGYSKGTRAAESLCRHKDALKQGARMAGIFMLGAMTFLFIRGLQPDMYLPNNYQMVSFADALESVLPGLLPLGMLGIIWHMLTKKNRSLLMCVLLLLAVGMLGALLGLFGGFFISPLHLPWLNL